MDEASRKELLDDYAKNRGADVREKLIIEYGRAVARDPKQIPDELFARLQAVFNDETIVVLTTMAVFMIANNVFNDALQVEPEP